MHSRGIREEGKIRRMGGGQGCGKEEVGIMPSFGAKKARMLGAAVAYTSSAKISVLSPGFKEHVSFFAVSFASSFCASMWKPL